ncbi:type II toxin-antitoxin system prevent-host-death family antitoxin [Buchananella felis]|uniref:type II toxin-antitoxin system Phd/YefM family antitoxin n=1 Tax=Buchananella felis TaxID=3231492 RepID=UPI003526F841
MTSAVPTVSTTATLAAGNFAAPPIRRLSQRELRNESGQVLRAVSAGESFVLTNKGIPVGRLVPLDAPEAALTITRPASRKAGWAELGITRKRTPGELAELLDSLREDRL